MDFLKVIESKFRFFFFLILLLGFDFVANAAPMPAQLAINSDKKVCFAFFPGDEHFSVSLKDRQNWKTYSFGFQKIIVTPFGKCHFEQGELKDCCQKLGFTLLSNDEAGAYLEKQTILNPSAQSGPINQPIPEPETLKNKKSDELPKSQILYFLFVVFMNLILLFLIANISKKIKNSNESKRNIAYAALISTFFPSFVLLITFFKSYHSAMSDPHTQNVVVAIFIAGFNSLIMSVVSFTIVVICLLAILYELSLIIIPLLMAGLYLGFNANRIIPQFFQLYQKKIVQPQIEMKKKNYLLDINSWPRKLDLANLPPQIKLEWKNRSSIVLKNMFPMKISVTIKLFNPRAHLITKYDPLLESCQIFYQQEIESQATIEGNVSQCQFEIDQKLMELSIYSDIGYSAFSDTIDPYKPKK
jgi:hypothetical protein